MPRVSVLLPVHDARPWLPAAIASLSRQSFTDFEIVAVDDGSTDGSSEWLDAARRREPRLRVEHAAHEGLPRALERARSLARGALIARHDADDVSHRDRLIEQVEHLGSHPRDDAVGTRVRLFPAHAVGAGMRRWTAWHNALLDHDAMTRELLIDSPLAHGTAMIRGSALERVGGWAERGWAEDLDLWIRLAESGARFAKLPRLRYGWRQHAASATRTDPRYAQERFVALKIEALERGLLRAGAQVTLVGVGTSLERWRAALGPRVGEVVVARRPHVEARWAAPIVLVYVAAAARSRWRSALHAAGRIEMKDFIFVS